MIVMETINLAKLSIIKMEMEFYALDFLTGSYVLPSLSNFLIVLRNVMITRTPRI